MFTLSDKNILITNYSIQDYAGAEINTLSIAKALYAMGAQVEIAAFNFAFPVRSEFEKENLKVTNVFFEKLGRTKYDLIWGHHSAVLSYVIWELGVYADNIIFSALSPFEPLEAAPSYADALTLCIANSQETKKQMLLENVKEENVYVFPNYITNEMFHVKNHNKYGKRPERAAIVSNHLPSELLELSEILCSKNIVMDIYGQGHIQTLINADILMKYDLIITIGKTVQYAMGLGVPVFCYDIHGGPGYLHEENIQEAFYYNFSGRGGFGKRCAEELYREIMNGYEKNKMSVNRNREFIKKHCLLEDNMTALFAKIENRHMDLNKIRYRFFYEKRLNQAFVREYRYNLHRKMQVIDLEADLKKTISDREEILKQKEDEIRALENRIQTANAQIHNQERMIAGLRKETEQKDRALEQKEMNCQYLLEVIQERENELKAINANKWWKRILWLSMWKRRIKKGICHPGLVLDKLFGRTDFSAEIVLPEDSEQQQEKISVAIPIYDRTEILRESIESILNQSYENFELILVCDGSPKETLEVVKSYENHKKVRTFYYQDNSGNAVRGRNKAIREADGRYLAFQDSDDIADTDRLKISLEYMKIYDADIVYGGWRALVDGTREIDLENGQEVFSPDCDYQMLRNVCVPCQSTVMAKTDALRSVGGLKESMQYREDHELWLRLAYYGYKFKSIDKVLTTLRLHSQNLELTYLDEDAKWYKKMMTEHKIKNRFKPKIVYVIPSCGISGGIAVICQHVNRLQKRGFDVLLLSEDSSNLQIDWFPDQKVEIVSLNQIPKHIDILVATGWSTAYTIKKIEAERKYYFVQSDETRFHPAGSADFTKALETYHMDYEFITEAKWIQKWLKENFQKNAHYVPNGLDEQIIYQTEPIAAKGNKLRVLLEGPIDIPYKGMEDAFHAVEGLDCEVWCISSAGRPKPDWKCDRFFEKVPMNQMKSIYSSCDLLLKMSRVEGFFGPPLEMMACGGACVVSKVTGYDEYIIDGENALVVEQGDVKGAHDALQKLMENTSLRQHLIENGKKTAQEWDWEFSIDILEQIYTSEISKDQ